jgi:VanZ family protein
MKSFARKISAYKPYLFWLLLGLVTFAMLMELPPRRGGWPHWDKVQHVVVFVVLTGLACWAFPKRKWLIACVLVIYGALVEWMQAAFTTTRLPSLGDWLADVAGILLVLLVCWCVGCLVLAHAKK